MLTNANDTFDRETNDNRDRFADRIGKAARAARLLYPLAPGVALKNASY